MGQLLRLTAALALLSTPTLAMDLAEGTLAPPVPAHTAYCANPQYAADCRVDTREAAVIAYSEKLLLDLRTVNAGVNGRIAQVKDREHWGVEDSWNRAEDGQGDCEDIQLLKREILVRQGLPRRALLITVVLDENHEGHAVLMVRTTKGDLILDNKQNRVLPWDETGYRYIKRESQSGPGWVWLQAVMSPPATASMPEEE